MRIVAVADTHTFQDELPKLPEGDVFIHAGDLLRAGTLQEMAPVARWIRELPFAHKLIVPGNHDWCFHRAPSETRSMLGPDVCVLIDQAHTIGGVRFWGSPWVPAYGGWAYNLERGESLAARWALIPDTTQVLITHGPPLGFGDRFNGQEHIGCEDLRATLERVRPALHLFGHVHQDAGRWRENQTLIANVTTWESTLPATVFEVTQTADGAVSTSALSEGSAY